METGAQTLRLPGATDWWSGESWAWARRLARRRTALFGLVVIAAVVAAALFAPVAAPFDPIEQDITQRLKPPGGADERGRTHLLGTDHLGRDILSRILFGARIALLVGFSAGALSRAPGL